MCWQTVTRCTHKWDMWSVSGVAWQDSPGEREMCKLSHHVSSSCVSLTTAPLGARGRGLGTTVGAQTRDPRCWVTNRRTDFISTHTGQTERLQDEHASLSSSVAAAAARAEYVLSCNQLETFKLHMSDEANSSYFTGLMPLISNWTYRPESEQRQSNTSWLPHLIYVAWYQSCIRLSSQCVDLTLGTNCSSCYTLQL